MSLGAWPVAVPDNDTNPMSTDEAKRGFYRNSVKQGEFDRLVELPVQIVQQLGQALTHESKRHYSITVAGVLKLKRLLERGEI